MKCKVGDRVRFLNDVGGGTVVRLVGNSQVLVRDGDGFDIPVLLSEVVVVSDDFQAAVQKTDIYAQAKDVRSGSQKVKPIIVELEEEDEDDEPLVLTTKTNEPERSVNSYEVLLGFYPDNQAAPTEGTVSVYLINDSSFSLLYSVGWMGNDGYLQHVKGGELGADSKTLLLSLKQSELSRLSELYTRFMIYKAGRYPLLEPESMQLELNPVKLFRANAFAENDYFDGKAMIHKLLSSEKTLADYLTPSAEDIAKAMKEKKQQPVAYTPKHKATQEVEEVDLHIDQLVERTTGLSNGEIVEIQLSRFTTALDLGITSGTKRMVFIHGVGNGKLKHELRRLLDTQYAGKVRYQDASFREYGYGATMVILG